MQLSWQSICLACTEPWRQSSSQYKMSMIIHACNPRTREMEAGRSKVRGQPGICKNKTKSNSAWILYCIGKAIKEWRIVLFLIHQATSSIFKHNSQSPLEMGFAVIPCSTEHTDCYIMLLHLLAVSYHPTWVNRQSKASSVLFIFSFLVEPAPAVDTGWYWIGCPAAGSCRSIVKGRKQTSGCQVSSDLENVLGHRTSTVSLLSPV